MELTQAVNQLYHQGESILSLCAAVSESQAHWKPDTENWSILEVLNHLLKEERMDFRNHLGVIFQDSQEAQPEISPENLEKDLTNGPDSLERILLDFKSEREISIAWLNALQKPDWESTITFKWGSLSAGDLLASWLAHDLLHLRQLVILIYHVTSNESQPFDTAYAGEW